jgi:SAM-dependent methyltransferase
VTEEPRATDWSQYLSDFHARRPGITEDVLTQSRSNDGRTPYEWVVEPIPRSSVVLDLACGSGPCLSLRPDDRWIGLDRSDDELARARSGGAKNLVRADATTLPFRDESFDAVVCSMALMLIDPLEQAVAEMSRILGARATLVVLIPGHWPLQLRDVYRYTRLLRHLGEWRLQYVNDARLRRLTSLFGDYGLRVVNDSRQRFSFPFASDCETSLFVQSLYLPRAHEAHIERGEEFAARWVGSNIGIPLRRLTLTKRS